MQMLKVGSIHDTQSAEIAIKDPTTGKKLATVTMAGPEHPKRKAIEFSKQRRMITALARSGKIENIDPVELEQDKIDLLVACTLAWDGIADAKGEPIPCTAENARTLYSADGHGWLRKSLYEAMDERDRFIASSAAA
jgi:hypothetical protein